MQERAGDAASDYHLYGDAAKYYQLALNEKDLRATDTERISGKLGEMLLLNGDFESAEIWFERSLAAYRADAPDRSESTNRLLRATARLLGGHGWEEKLARVMPALRTSELGKDSRLAELISLRKAKALQTVHRCDEAAEILQKIGHVHQENDVVVRCQFFVQRAKVAAMAGKAQDAYENLEAAIDLMKNGLDPWSALNAWWDYAHIAQELGDILRAKACFEHALFVARRYGLAWAIYNLSVSYAGVLSHLGQASTAYEQVVEAVSRYQPSNAFDDMSWRCIPIAIQFRDLSLLAKCTRMEGDIEVAFQLQVPEVIGTICHAFAELYVFQGRPRAARVLLRRALERLRGAHFNLDLLIAIAQHGAFADIPQARILLEAHTTQPHSDVFLAGLMLFDAIVAHRRGALVQAQGMARAAAEHFDSLQWRGYAAQARLFLPGEEIEVTARSVREPQFIQMRPLLTTREQEVAGLVLRGFTNREIANELQIALHTVEKHMNAILHRLGIRSRYQVASLLQVAE